MKKVYLPYYISRAALSAGFSLLAFGFTWQAALAGLVLFGLFLLYLHSGWFTVDTSRPLTPLRRDARAQEAQRRALIAAVMAGLLAFFFLPTLVRSLGLAIQGTSLALPAAVLTYFAVEFSLLAKA